MRGEWPGAPGWGPEAHTEACKDERGEGGTGARPPERPAEPEVLTGREEEELEEENREAGGPCEKLLMSSQISSSRLRSSSLDDFGKVGGVKCTGSGKSKDFQWRAQIWTCKSCAYTQGMRQGTNELNERSGFGTFVWRTGSSSAHNWLQYHAKRCQFSLLNIWCCACYQI